MLNAEKYKKEILKICKQEGRIALRDDGLHRCGSISCGSCDFNDEGSCNARTLEWLLAEYKEPIKLSRLEYDFLKNINERWKWIARDESGMLCLYDAKPCKDSDVYNMWKTSNCFISVDDLFRDDIFTFIKWEDEEPWNIKDILEHCEVIDDD